MSLGMLCLHTSSVRSAAAMLAERPRLDRRMTWPFARAFACAATEEGVEISRYFRDFSVLVLTRVFS